MALSVDLGDGDADDLAARILGRKPTDSAERDAAVSSFAQLAVDEHVRWILGAERFRTLTELQTERVARLFEGPANGRPSVSRLYNDLSMSHGQAGYVARVLADRLQGSWRVEAKGEVRTALTSVEPRARKNVEESNDPSAHLTVRMSSMAKREFELVFEQIVEGGEELGSPIAQQSVGDQRFISVESEVVLRVLEELS